MHMRQGMVQKWQGAHLLPGGAFMVIQDAHAPEIGKEKWQWAHQLSGGAFRQLQVFILDI